MMKLTPELLAAARALARIDRADLAERSGLLADRITAFEEGRLGLDTTETGALRDAVEHFGAEFLPEGDAGVGVRLKFNRQETGQILGWEGEGGRSGDDDVP